MQYIGSLKVLRHRNNSPGRLDLRIMLLLRKLREVINLEFFISQVPEMPVVHEARWGDEVDKHPHERIDFRIDEPQLPSLRNNSLLGPPRAAACIRVDELLFRKRGEGVLPRKAVL